MQTKRELVAVYYMHDDTGRQVQVAEWADLVAVQFNGALCWVPTGSRDFCNTLCGTTFAPAEDGDGFIEHGTGTRWKNT